MTNELVQEIPLNLQQRDSTRRTVIADFSVIFDTDIGCCLYLYDKSKREFLVDTYNLINYPFIQYMILSRQEKNPIRFLFKDKYKKSADKIYNELYEKKWDQILTYSPDTTILKFLALGHKMIQLDVTINCRNEQERKKISKLFPMFKSVINLTDFSRYYNIYIHDFIDFLSLKNVSKNIKGKIINLYKYAPNCFNKNLSTNEITEYIVPFASYAEFNLVSPFKDFILPDGIDITNDKK